MSNRAQVTLSCVIRELDRDSSPQISCPGINSHKTADMNTEAVFVETMMDSEEEDMESPLSMSSTSEICPGLQGEGSDDVNLSGRVDVEESSEHASWDMEFPCVETKELETVFEDDVLSDSSGYLERSNSNCSIISDFRDRSDSTWSAMTLADRERSNSIASGFRERSYSTTCAHNETTFSSSGGVGVGNSGYRQRSYSTASEGRQRSASIGSIMPNPLRQSHHLSIYYLKSAFTFLNPKGKLPTIQGVKNTSSQVWYSGSCVRYLYSHTLHSHVRLA